MTAETKAASRHPPAQQQGQVVCGALREGPGPKLWLHSAGTGGRDFSLPCRPGMSEPCPSMAGPHLEPSVQSGPPVLVLLPILPIQKSNSAAGLLIHSLHHLFYYLFISLIIYDHSLIHSFTFISSNFNLLICSKSHLFNHLFIHRLTSSFNLFTYSFTHLLFISLIHH